MKIPGSPTKSASLKLFNRAALLDFPNVIRQDGSKYDIKVCGGVVTLKRI